MIVTGFHPSMVKKAASQLKAMIDTELLNVSEGGERCR
jgi:hypothetical protein